MSKMLTFYVDQRKFTVYLDEKNKIGDAYWVSIDTGYSALICEDGTICTPFVKKKVVDFFNSTDNTDICIALQDDDGQFPIFYHFKKIDNHYTNVFSTDLGDYNNNLSDKLKRYFYIEKYNDKYWLVRDNNSYSTFLYSPVECKQITPIFDDLVISERNGHLGYFVKNVYVPKDEDQEDLVFATYLFGCIDYDGNFSSHIVDYTLQDEYIIKNVKDAGIKEFTNLYKNIYYKYANLKKDAQAFFEVKLFDLYNEKIDRVGSIYQKDNTDDLCKIIQFRGK